MLSADELSPTPAAPDPVTDPNAPIPHCTMATVLMVVGIASYVVFFILGIMMGFAFGNSYYGRSFNFWGLLIYWLIGFSSGTLVLAISHIVNHLHIQTILLKRMSVK